MKKIRTAEDLAELRGAIAARAAGGWVLYEGAERLGGLGVEEVDVLEGAVLRWAGRLWRVTAWRERGGELRLAVRGAFGHEGKTLRIARDGEGPLAWGVEWFEEAVWRARDERADDRAVSVSIAPDTGSRDADDALAGGLVARARYERARGVSAELVVYSAPPALGAVANRLLWLVPRAAVRLVDVTTGETIRPHDQGDLASVGRAWWPPPELPDDPLVARILELAPGALERVRRPGERADRILLNGLECARIRAGAATFGVGRRRERLDAESWPRFASLVAELEHLRSPDPPDRNSSLYRAFPERWLAAVIRRDVSVLDPALDPETVYEQVPATRGDSRERIDMLAVTRTGRLAVIELKAAEDRALPLQGLSYWTRVRWHHARGEIARRGYFPDRVLDPRPPLLYLAAPLFRLHASVRIALELFAPEVETVAVGLNTGWRSGARVLARYENAKSG